ncbi:hypothetical protein [Nonomuraea sp. NPDC049309]|uniref:hypothetical protein n=1 Tax=Nonomuraea sp. NPDC049309 TaxID=3364350 RepID=UPI00371DEA1B
MRGGERARAAALLAAALWTGLLAGCGTGDGGGADVASVTGAGAQAAAEAEPSEDPKEKALKFAQCMRENGIDVPDPDSSGRFTMRFDKNTPREKVEAAQEACKQWAPSGDGKRGGDGKVAERLRKLAQCMRDNGVESYPDPEGGMMRITPEVAEDPDFEAAKKKCQKEAGEAGLGDL